MPAAAAVDRHPLSTCTPASPCSWSAPLTWNPSGVPLAGDTVIIDADRQVTADTTTATALYVDLSGTLAFSRASSSTLTLMGGDTADHRSLIIRNGGKLDMGSSASLSIPATCQALLILPRGTPSQHYGLYIANGGVFSAYGAAKGAAGFAFQDVVPGGAYATQVQVASATAQNWVRGDIITIGQTEVADFDNFAIETETRTISGLSTTGSTTTITWSSSKPILYTHSAAKGVRVGNLTRNVVIRSSGTNTASDTAYVESDSNNGSAFTAVNAEFAYLGANEWGEYGIWFNSAGGSFTGCSIHDGFNPIVVNGPTAMPLTGNLICGNDHDLYSEEAGLQLVGNDICASGEYGVDGAVLLADGNYFYSNVYSAINTGTPGFVIKNNRMLANRGYGVYSEGAGTIANNQLSTNGDGIWAGGATLVSSNTLSHSGGIGLGSNGTVAGNTVSHSDGNGIYLEGGSRAMNNEVSFCAEGIAIGNSGVNVVANNRSHDNFDDGIIIEQNSAAAGSAITLGNLLYNNVAGLGMEGGGDAYNLSVDDVLGYDPGGNYAPNPENEFWFGGGFTPGQLTEVRGARVETVGSLATYDNYTQLHSGSFLSFKENGAAGSVFFRGDLALPAAHPLTLDAASNLYDSTATTPVLFRGNNHSAQVTYTDNATAVSQLVTIQYNDSDSLWYVAGSSTAFFGTIPKSGGALNVPSFRLTLTPGSASPATGDALYFALMSSSNDQAVLKSLTVGSVNDDGPSTLAVSSGSALTLRGTPSTPVLVGRSLDATHDDPALSAYFTFISSGSLTVVHSTITDVDSLGIRLSGSSPVLFASSTFRNLGDQLWNGDTGLFESQDRRAYLTLSDLASNATFYGMTFEATTGRTNATSYAVVAEEPNSSLRWYFPTYAGGLTGDDRTLQNIRHVYWYDNVRPGTPPWFSAGPGPQDGEVSLAWTSPGDDGMAGGILGGSFLVFRTTDTADLAGATPDKAVLVISTSALPGSGHVWTDSGLLLGTSYYYRLWAGDEMNNTSLLPVGTTSQAGWVRPYSPSSIQVSVGTDSVRLSWDPPLSPPPAYVNGYRIKYSSVSLSRPDVFESTTSLQSFEATNLLFETTYTFSLTTMDTGSPPLESDPAQLSVKTGAVTPSGVRMFMTGNRTAGVARNAMATLEFTRAMLPGTVMTGGTVSWTLLKDHLGVSSSAVVAVDVSSDPTGTSYLFSPRSSLEGNGTYEIVVGTAATDIYGKTLVSSATLRFTTLLNHIQRNVVTDGVGAATVDLPAGALAFDGYLSSGTTPAGTSEATRKLVAATGDSLRSPVSGEMPSISVYDAFTHPQALLLPVSVSLPYQDSDGDGIVNGASPSAPPVRAKTLAIYWLDENTDTWVRLNSSVDPATKRVTAFAPRLAVFAAMGQADADASGAYAFPSPWRASKGGVITFTGIGQGGRVQIYDAAGRRVREIADDADLGEAAWDAKDSGGSPVPSGVYFYRVTNGGKVKTGKMGVIR